MYDDEFNGVGGSYILDPKTGKRTPVPESNQTDAPATATQDTAGGTAQPSKKTAQSPKTGA